MSAAAAVVMRTDDTPTVRRDALRRAQVADSTQKITQAEDRLLCNERFCRVVISAITRHAQRFGEVEISKQVAHELQEAGWTGVTERLVDYVHARALLAVTAKARRIEEAIRYCIPAAEETERETWAEARERRIA